jgi:hypothetical protein
MANNINIILSISDEDRARIDALIGKLAPVTVNNYTEIGAETPQEKPQEAPKAEPQEKSQPEPETATEAAESEKYDVMAPQFTVADVRQKVMNLSSSGKRAEAKALVFEYADRITDIPAEKVDEVMERLTALEG